MDDDSPVQDAGTLRYLKWLVTALTVTMIGGFLVIVALFVMRFGGTGTLDLPDTIALPDGTEAEAFTQGKTWFAIVTTDQEILIYDRATGQLRQRVVVGD